MSGLASGHEGARTPAPVYWIRMGEPICPGSGVWVEVERGRLYADCPWCGRALVLAEGHVIRNQSGSRLAHLGGGRFSIQLRVHARVWEEKAARPRG